MVEDRHPDPTPSAQRKEDFNGRLSLSLCVRVRRDRRRDALLAAERFEYVGVANAPSYESRRVPPPPWRPLPWSVRQGRAGRRGRGPRRHPGEGRDRNARANVRQLSAVLDSAKAARRGRGEDGLAADLRRFAVDETPAIGSTRDQVTLEGDRVEMERGRSRRGAPRRFGREPAERRRARQRAPPLRGDEAPERGERNALDRNRRSRSATRPDARIPAGGGAAAASPWRSAVAGGDQRRDPAAQGVEAQREALLLKKPRRGSRQPDLAARGQSVVAGEPILSSRRRRPRDRRLLTRRGHQIVAPNAKVRSRACAAAGWRLGVMAVGPGLEPLPQRLWKNLSWRSTDWASRSGRRR